MNSDLEAYLEMARDSIDVMLMQPRRDPTQEEAIELKAELNDLITTLEEHVIDVSPAERAMVEAEHRMEGER